MTRRRWREDPRLWSLGVPLALVLLRLAEGVLVSQNQSTLMRLFGASAPFPSAAHGPFVNLERWDGAWYQGIARHGYASRADAAFFPGYPLLARLVHEASLGLVGLDVALFALSWGSLVVAAPAFVRFASRRGLSPGLSLAALVLLLFSPGSCFLVAWYPLSPYLLASLAALSLLFARRRWGAALVAGAASGLTPVGVALSLALALDALVRRRREPLAPRLAVSALGFWGVAAYALFCQWRYGSLLEPLAAQAGWSTRAAVPFGYLGPMVRTLLVGHLAPAVEAYFGLNVLCEVVALAVVVRLVVALVRGDARGDHSTYALFTIGSLVIPASYVAPYGLTVKPIGFARLSGASIGFDTELVRGARGRYALVAFGVIWLGAGLLGQILFCGGWFT